MERKVIAELLDDDLGTPEEIASSLVDLRQSTTGLAERPPRLSCFVASLKGLTDQSCRFWKWARGWEMCPLGPGIRLRRTVSRCRLHCWTACCRTCRRRTSVRAGDAMHLPFCDDAFDVVGCTLFAHHFEPEMLPLLQRGLAGCRRAVLVNDLIRSRMHLPSPMPVCRYSAAA